MTEIKVFPANVDIPGEGKMEIENFRFESGHVLAVDDEPVARQQLVFQIAALRHRVTSAGSAAEAQEILTREGSSAFDCLITDCWMPGETGLDLLLWLAAHDRTMASIVISKAVDEKVVTQTLRGGASDFLTKPVFSEELNAALQKTIGSTRRRRRHVATMAALKEAGVVQRRMNSLGMSDQVPTPVTVCYHPCHDAGGDLVAFFALNSAQVLIVVADVSGHDLKSAFISAYFQGMLRALVEQRVPVESILARFNRFLIQEWSQSSDVLADPDPEITSLAVCAATIDLTAGRVSLLNSGFPLASRVDRNGQPWPCGEAGGNPLGWLDPNPVPEKSIAVKDSDRLVIWTDGLEDLASQLQVSEWSLAFRILLAKETGHPPAWLAGAPDDVLMVVIGLEKRSQESYKFPILAENYAMNQIDDIDESQALWQRSLAFAFPDLPQDGSISEILLCTREAVLNGLQHGCSKPSDLCRLTMAFDNGSNQLQIEVADPGLGHDFDFRTRQSPDSPDDHRGLLLIHGLTRRMELDSAGAVVRMFFDLEPNLKRH